MAICWETDIIFRVIPANVTNLFFLITSKVVKIEPSYWMEKKQNFMRIFPISMIWKSDFWSLHNALISKSQNAEKSGKLLFSNCFRDLLSENFHIITKRYDLNPNDTPVNYVFHGHEWWDRLEKGQRLQKNYHFDDHWPFQMTAKSNMIIKITIYTYKTWILSVCVSVHVFRSHQKSQGHEILALGLIWANLKHDEARFSKFWILRGGPHMVQC